MNKASLTQSYQVYPRAQFSDQFYIIFFSATFSTSKASFHNFADDNTFASFSSILKLILKSECEPAINWFHNNKMTVNPDKFQVILLHKRGSDNTNIEVKIGNEKIKSTSSVKLLEVHIDDKLNLIIILKNFVNLLEIS